MIIVGDRYAYAVDTCVMSHTFQFIQDPNQLQKSRLLSTMQHQLQRDRHPTRYNLKVMSAKFHGFLAAALGAALVATPSAQAPKAPAPAAPRPAGQTTAPATPSAGQPNPTFRVRVDLVT